MNTELDVQNRELDPLRSAVALPHRHVLFPYGLPVQIKSNHLAAIRVAENSWGSCRALHQEQPVEVRVVVSNSHQRRRPPAPMFRAQGNLMTIVADAQNYACCDLSRGLGFAVLTRAAIKNRDYLRYYFVEAMVYTMLDALHLVIFHAACSAFRGRGFVFVGETGAGKSSLAYACARRGWTYISDDATAILRRRPSHRMALGNPRTFRFRPTASELFPEINGPIRVRNQKPTIEVTIDSLPGIVSAEVCHLDFVLFLKRDSTSQRPILSPIDKESALKRLFFQSLPDELDIGEERLRAIERMLAESQAFEFTYGDLGAAIEVLEALARTA